MRLIVELKRRNVLRMAGLYLVGGWLVVQVAATLLPVFEAPPWVMKVLVGLLAIGFVAALVFSWIYELTPDGIKRTDEVAADESIASQTGRRLDVAVLVAVALLLGLMLMDRWLPRSAPPPAAVAPLAAAPQAPPPQTPEVAEKSVAVLPFVALTSGVDDGYFADGLTEEILNALAQLPELKVTARTSAFHFKGKDLPIGEIATALGVAHVVEGSVRRSGERVRITAQLIRASDGFHLWSENYDRTLEDAIAVQDDIAGRVADALNVLLDDAAREAMRRAAIGDVDAFVAYQRGLSIYEAAHLNRRGDEFLANLAKANAEFDAALVRVPKLFPARFLMLDVHSHRLMDAALYGLDTPPSVELMAQSEAALREGLATAAQSARTPGEAATLAITRISLSNDWTGMASASAQLYAVRTCVPTLFNDAWMALGGAREAADFYAAQVECDPLSHSMHWDHARATFWSGDAERAAQAVRAAEAFVDVDYRLEALHLLLLLERGEFDAADAYLAGTAGAGIAGREDLAVQVAAARGDPAEARRRWEKRPPRRSGNRIDIGLLAWMGRRDEANAMAAVMDALPLGHYLLAEVVSHCYCGAPFDLESTPNFKARLAESGMQWPPGSPLKLPLKTW